MNEIRSMICCLGEVPRLGKDANTTACNETWKVTTFYIFELNFTYFKKSIMFSHS